MLSMEFTGGRWFCWKSVLKLCEFNGSVDCRSYSRRIAGLGNDIAKIGELT